MTGDVAKSEKIKPKKTSAKQTVKKAPPPEEAVKKSLRVKRKKNWLQRFVDRYIYRYLFRGLIAVVAVVALFSVINPPTTFYMLKEKSRLGHVDHQWVSMDDISPHMLHAVVAAEDVNFCTHFGFDIGAIRQAVSEGGTRGASTISQQTVKNTFLWPSRSWVRKAFEAVLTPLVEVLWSKRRILEVYLNVIEFDKGVFGVDAAAVHYFRKTPDRLSLTEAALLAAILPNPKGRSASRPTQSVERRARAIADGARTIRNTSKVSCFED
ncbi:MAG: monofunctional biosynthetic peptidoglycan transglycosylase [Halocynthiibacter sp.]